MSDFNANNHSANLHNVQNNGSKLMRDRRPAGNMLWAVLFFFAATVGFTGCIGDIGNVPEPPPPSPNALLSTLTIIPGTLQPVFSSGVLNYTVDVLNTITSVTVTVTPKDANASMKINGQATTPGQARTITLGVPGSSTPIPIVVTAQDGSQNTYIVTVTRAALAANNSLQSLTVSPGSLTPAFNPSTTSYTVDVVSSVTSVTVTAQAQDAGATVSINGGPATNSSSQSVPLGAPGSNTNISIVVEAPNGNLRTYLVTVSRAALGGNNNLQSLTVSPGSLSPGFIANMTTYAVAVASGVGSVTVTAQAQDTGATVSIDGQTTTSLPVTLNVPGQSTLVTIVVTAPNLTQKTYSIFVNRAALGGNNNLQSLTVSPGGLNETFNANTTSYTVDVLTTVTSVTVTATAQDAGATVSINNQTTTSRSVSLGAAGSSTPISIEVTAPNGSQKTYSVIVNRAALGGNNNLQTLTVTSGSLVPAFIASTTSYTVAVASGVASVTVAATAQDAGATVSINNQTTTSLLVSLGAAGSSTPISIEVTAPNGSQKTYSVIVNRAAIVLSGNNNLSALDVSAGALIETFDAGNTIYTVTAPNTTTDTTITATVADSTATLTINGSPATSGAPSANILLVGGTNPPISVVVTAENSAEKTYTITITVEP